MFSYFENGITDTNCNKFIDLPELVKKIKNNTKSDLIEEIRTLRRNGDEFYKQLKKQLPNITPNCLVKRRSLDEDSFSTNFIKSSGYIYFDFDTTNPDEYKDYFIRKYGHLASLVCFSSSKGGISVLFKVKNEITNDNFELIRNQIKDTILIGEPIDPSAGGFGRAMFISSDTQVYFNYENEIELSIPEVQTEPIKKEVKQSNSCGDFNNRLNSPFSVLSIDKLYEKLQTSTHVDVINPVVDFKPIDFVEVYIPQIIKDGTKHTIYSSMIRHLMYLNPDIEKEYIFSFLFYVNNRFARPRMERKELIRFFNFVYNGIKRTGTTNHQHFTKSVHFNPDCGISAEDKIKISNTLNGYHRRNNSIKKIQAAKSELEQVGLKLTQKNVVEVSGLSPKTVRAHFNSTEIDMDKMVAMINDSVFANDSTEEINNSTSTTGKIFKRVSNKRKGNDPLIEPACSIRPGLVCAIFATEPSKDD